MSYKTPTKKWVKATWLENRQQACEAIPRSWVSRSLSTVWWPPSGINFKKAIETCYAPASGHTGWAKFQLLWCSDAKDTLAEAQTIDTGDDSAENSNGELEDEILATPLEPNKKQFLGRGFRSRIETSRLQGYELESPAIDTNDTESIEASAQSTSAQSTVVRVLTGRVGEMSAAPSMMSLKPQLRPQNSAQKNNMSTPFRIQAGTMKKSVHQVQVDAEDNIDVNNNDITDAPSHTDMQQIKIMISQLSAVSKIRHDELMLKMQALEKKISHIDRKISANSGGSIDREAEKSSGDEEDQDARFCVCLPVHTFADFHSLDDELAASHTKRKALRKMMLSLGGRDPNDLIARCISSVIQRPELAQYFNCGGHIKAGAVLEEPKEKRNFMGTQTQKVLLYVLKKVFKEETEKSLRSRTSDVLKRSSTMKGGDYYKKKKMQLHGSGDSNTNPLPKMTKSSAVSLQRNHEGISSVDPSSSEQESMHE